MEITVTKLETFLNRKLPVDYLLFIEYVKQNFIGGLVTNEIYIYIDENDIIERYQTFEMGKYLPNYLGIGNDSGGSEILISLTEEKSKIYYTDHGAYFENELHIVAQDFKDFIHNDFDLESISYKIPRVMSEQVKARNELHHKLFKLNYELEKIKRQKLSGEISLKDYLLQKRIIEEQKANLNN